VAEHQLVRGGTAIENARVMAMGMGAETVAMTASDGSFTLTDLAAGTVRVIVRKEDDFIQEMRSLSAPARDVVIDVPAGGRVNGRVVEKGSRKPITSFQGIQFMIADMATQVEASRALLYRTLAQLDAQVEGAEGQAPMVKAYSNFHPNLWWSRRKQSRPHHVIFYLLVMGGLDTVSAIASTYSTTSLFRTTLSPSRQHSPP